MKNLSLAFVLGVAGIEGHMTSCTMLENGQVEFCYKGESCKVFVAEPTPEEAATGRYFDGIVIVKGYAYLQIDGKTTAQEIADFLEGA